MIASPMRRGRPRRGFALLSALFALILMSAMVVGLALRASTSRRTAQWATLRSQTFSDAQSALVAASIADANTIRALPIGAQMTLVTTPTASVVAIRTDTIYTTLIASASSTFGSSTSIQRMMASYIIPRDTAMRRLIRVPEQNWFGGF